ncbi:MAG: DUF1320 domain-containing protein [Pseudomonadota bacterium]|nr:DUF1320 domain-containing protein [Pseudomonadota bacterium]
MTYATLTTLNAQFGAREVVALTDRDMDGVPDQAVLDDALAAADSLIDSYIGRRYALPLADVPKLLVTLAGTLVRYQLSGAGVTETDPTRDRYRDAIKLLEAIRDGNIHLGPDPAGDQPAQASAIRVTGGNRKFVAGTLDGDYL